MNKILQRLTITASAISIGLLSSGFTTTPASAGVLENLERERASIIKSILDPELSPPERQKKIQGSKMRLIDLERMVLRDNKLKGRNTPTVRRAFENYDLTFLLHAATEKNLTITDNWLAELGITTQNIMSAQVKRQSRKNEHE
jgi:hypothetical protein